MAIPTQYPISKVPTIRGGVSSPRLPSLPKIGNMQSDSSTASGLAAARRASERDSRALLAASRRSQEEGATEDARRGQKLIAGVEKTLKNAQTKFLNPDKSTFNPLAYEALYTQIKEGRPIVTMMYDMYDPQGADALEFYAPVKMTAAEKMAAADARKKIELRKLKEAQDPKLLEEQTAAALAASLREQAVNKLAGTHYLKIGAELSKSFDNHRDAMEYLQPLLDKNPELKYKLSDDPKKIIPYDDFYLAYWKEMEKYEDAKGNPEADYKPLDGTEKEAIRLLHQKYLTLPNEWVVYTNQKTGKIERRLQSAIRNFERDTYHKLLRTRQTMKTGDETERDTYELELNRFIASLENSLGSYENGPSGYYPAALRLRDRLGLEALTKEKREYLAQELANEKLLDKIAAEAQTKRVEAFVDSPFFDPTTRYGTPIAEARARKTLESFDEDSPMEISSLEENYQRFMNSREDS